MAPSCLANLRNHNLLKSLNLFSSQALTGTKRKIPVRVLRFFKEQLYQLVHAPLDLERKLAVVDFEEIGSADTVEFVIGVGVANRQQKMEALVEEAVHSALSQKGYAGVTAEDVFTDCLQEKSQFVASDLLGSAFPGLARSHRTFIPIFRYLREAGIDSMQKLAASRFEGAKKIVKKILIADYTLPSYLNRYKKAFFGLSTSQIIEKSSSRSEAVLMLAFQPDCEVDRVVLRDFLRATTADLYQEPYRTSYRKLVCRYDRLVYGFQ